MQLRWKNFGHKLFFCGLYFVQGAILAYVSNFQKPYLNKSGVSTDDIALLTSTMILPFIGKIFFGILSDRISLFGWGHRKPYMLLGLALGAGCFLTLMHVDPRDSFHLFFVLMVTATFGMALFDTSTDGFAIDLNRRSGKDESGAIQSYMMSGKALGYILLSGAFGWAVGHFGYAAIFATLAGIIAIIFGWVLIFAKENQQHKAKHATPSAGALAFLKDLGWPTFYFAGYAIAYSILSFGIDGLVTFYLHSELKFEASNIGVYGASRGVGAILGAVVAGFCAGNWGRKITAYSALFFLGFAMLALLMLQDTRSAIYIGALWGAAWSFQETVFVVLAMRMAEKNLAATAFAILMIFSNIGTAIGEGLATSLSGSIGFKTVFIGFAVANLAVAPLLALVFRKAPDLDVSEGNSI